MEIICKRCLLSEISDEDTKKTVRELIETMPEDKKADDTTYRQRLSICKECDELINGMCGKCGGGLFHCHYRKTIVQCL